MEATRAAIALPRGTELLPCVARAAAVRCERRGGAERTLPLPPSRAQALIRDKRWRNLALLAISKNRQRYNITSGNMETLAALLIEKGASPLLAVALRCLRPASPR